MHKTYSLAGFFAVASMAFISSTMTSCGSKADGKEKTDSTSTAAAYTISPELQSLIAKIRQFQEWPYKVDTTLLKIEDKVMEDSLSSADVKMLSVNWLKHDLTDEVEVELSDYYKIDSVHRAGAYKEYCEALEPGNTQTSVAYPLASLNVDKDTWVLVWALRASSFPACPHFSLNNAYGSVIYKGEVTQSFKMGENMSAGDPPSHMDRFVTSSINEKGLLTLDVVENSTYDGEEMSTVNEHYEFQLVNGKLKMKKEEKKKPVTSKIPQ
ncbi:MAG TPA: hypothetical protein VD905_02545 [Flavobacteriales bacterium]|nr:hypothetical protein [Flavobacteriales bacterium]